MYNTDTKSIIKQDLQPLKKDKLRYNEYYNLQNTFDNLYKQSLEGSKFTKLFNLISSEENILLAYRNVKTNTGSKTAGTNRHNINYWKTKDTKIFVQYIQNRLMNYKPQKVRRVEIPKPNGKIRPLGIPCIEDRIIQQCIKQVLEPICEAKFHPHSYGFRPNRGT
ncbi:reverse transcriptase domain-containing protein, partial [Clostridioides difficile]|nr:reverse transcriptase domain-containing protein [Clostridioides difficile]